MSQTARTAEGDALAPHQADLTKLTSDTSSPAGMMVRRRIGRVVSVTGSKLLVLIDRKADQLQENAPRVGRLVCIESGQAEIVATITAINAPSPGFSEDEQDILIAELELAGELAVEGPGVPVFRHGITSYPGVGDVAAMARQEDLELIYGAADPANVSLGQIKDSVSVQAMANPVALVEGNLLITGAENCGKSSAVITTVRALVRRKLPLTTVIIDPDCEYGRSFGRAAHVVNAADQLITHWMLTIPELISLLESFGGPLMADAEELLSEAVQAARKVGVQRLPTVIATAGSRAAVKITADTPVPYRLSDAISYLDRGQNTDDRYSPALFLHLRARLTNIAADRQYTAIFGSASALDVLPDHLGQIFRVPTEGKPITVVQLDHLIGPVAQVIVSVIARMAEALIESKAYDRQLLLCVEKADRFIGHGDSVPVSHEPVSRLLTGSGMGQLGVALVTSRPRQIDESMLESCQSMFVMRTTSRQDQSFLARLTPDASIGLTDAIGVLGTAECVAVGRGVAFPSRFRFDQLPDKAVPVTKDKTRQEDAPPVSAEHAVPGHVVNLWRFSEAIFKAEDTR